MKTSCGDSPWAKAAPYTKGLKVEPGCRRAWFTWSNCACSKPALPTQALTRAVRGSIARKPACSSMRSSPRRRPRSAICCSWRSWRATAWLAAFCRRESRVVRTTSPSA